MRFIIGAFAAILVILLVIVLIFNGGDDTQQTAAPEPVQLSEYASRNSMVSFTTVGSVVGQDEQRSIIIEVTPSERRLQILGGFGQTVISSQTFSNSTVAYQNFLSAIDGQGFTTSKESSVQDPATRCPTGQRYEYKLTENGDSVSDLWSVSCDRSGTFDGRASTMRQLFQAQIPNYSTLVQGVTL